MSGLIVALLLHACASPPESVLPDLDVFERGTSDAAGGSLSPEVGSDAVDDRPPRVRRAPSTSRSVGKSASVSRSDPRPTWTSC